MRRIVPVVLCIVSALIPLPSASDPLPEPVAERISSAMAGRFRIAGWRVDLTMVDDRLDRERQLCVTAIRRRTTGTVRIVTELRGCTRKVRAYTADPSEWTGSLASEVRVRGDRFRQEYVDGGWHGTGVLGFLDDRVDVRLTFEGTGNPSPGATGNICGFYFAPPFVDPCFSATVERPATVDGRVTFVNVREMVEATAGSMRFWTDG